MIMTTLRDTANTHTSAVGCMPRFGSDITFTAVLIATSLPAPTTASTYDVSRLIERTTAGPAGEIDLVPAESTAEAILEIRRRSGLTWEELGDLFDVSRRSVHHWANGKPVTSRHDQMIYKMLAALRHLDQVDQISTRAFLLAVDPATGLSTLDLLKGGRFDEAMGRVEGVRAPERNRIPLSQAALDARRPQPPVFLLGAEQDRPDIPANARAVRLKRTPNIMKS